MTWVGELKGSGPHTEREHAWSFGKSMVLATEYEPAAPMAGELVFLHGRLRGSEGWGPVVTQFTRRFRCLTFDYPGYGGSFSLEPAAFSIPLFMDLLDGLLAHLKIRAPVLIGQDVGGGLAQRYALEHPERVGGLVLVNSVSVGHAVRPIPLGFKGRLARLRARWGGEPVPVVGVPRRAERALAALQECFLESREEPLLGERLSRLKLPALVLCGGRDWVNRLEIAAELARALPASVFFEHENAGHLICEEEPEWVICRIAEFLLEAGLIASPFRSARRSPWK